MLKKGFTLIELMIILVVIGILVAVGLPRFNQFIEEGRVSATKQEMSAIKSAAKMYEMHMRVMPQSTYNLMVAPADNYSNSKAPWIAGVEVWKGPYMDGAVEDVCTDAWGHPYIVYYETAGPSGFVVYSFGPDGLKGTATPNDDIKDWLRYDGGEAKAGPAGYFTWDQVPGNFQNLTPMLGVSPN
ncbi:MAG: type II secretion system protein GspG [Candidatus Wallbacteria bacterium]|nr:type II secretion system protein GspG [Candidatus Wallbacteria bacterium]